MARPKKDSTAVASAAFRIRLTAAEREVLEKKAAALEGNISDLIRAAVFRYKPPTPRVEREAVDELNRIGVNLNQIARHMHMTGELRADLNAAIAAVVTAIDRLV